MWCKRLFYLLGCVVIKQTDRLPTLFKRKMPQNSTCTLVIVNKYLLEQVKGDACKYGNINVLCLH